MSMNNYNNGKFNPTGEELGFISELVTIVATLFSAGGLGFFASLGFWLYGKDKVNLLERNSLNNAVNIQLSMLFGVLISYALMPILIGFFLLPIVLIAGVSMHVIDILNNRKGIIWNAPMIPKAFK